MDVTNPTASNDDANPAMTEVMCLIEAGYARNDVIAAMKKGGLTIADVVREYDDRRADTERWLKLEIPGEGEQACST
jgi:hypothetical protein